MCAVTGSTRCFAGPPFPPRAQTLFGHASAGETPFRVERAFRGRDPWRYDPSDTPAWETEFPSHVRDETEFRHESKTSDSSSTEIHESNGRSARRGKRPLILKRSRRQSPMNLENRGKRSSIGGSPCEIVCNCSLPAAHCAEIKADRRILRWDGSRRSLQPNVAWKPNFARIAASPRKQNTSQKRPVNSQLIPPNGFSRFIFRRRT